MSSAFKFRITAIFTFRLGDEILRELIKGLCLQIDRRGTCMLNQKKFLLFIPCYNCEKQITRVLDQLDENVMAYITQVLIIDNRSTDQTENVAKKYLEIHNELPAVLVRNNENYGLGGSHKVAFNYAIENGFDYVIVLHGDDQGSIKDFLPIIEDGTYEKFDCCLGSRFMQESRSEGYSLLRTVGNYGFNWLFSLVARQNITDLGSGLNLYKVSSLSDRFYEKFPDTLYFNDCMILAQCYMKQRVKFVPISWREEDQVSNNKLLKFAIALLKLCVAYVVNPSEFVVREHREDPRTNYSSSVVVTNL